MNRLMSFLRDGAILVAGSIACFGSALALPVLQLDIEGGSYVGGDEESMVTNDPVFNLYSYLTEKQGADTGDLFRLSIALIPKPAAELPVPNFGSFLVDGTAYDVTDMIYGTPPVEALSNPDELPGHGVYDSYYLELDYFFDPNDEAAPVNVQDNGGLGPQAGTGMFYHLFEIDVSNMLSGFFLHFDTYDPTDPNTIKAPFSHDARTVPEPGTLLLFGAGLLGLAFSRRLIAAKVA